LKLRFVNELDAQANGSRRTFERLKLSCIASRAVDYDLFQTHLRAVEAIFNLIDNHILPSSRRTFERLKRLPTV